MTLARLIGAILVLLAGSEGVANAAAGAWQASERVEARLVSAVDAVGDLSTVPLGIELRIADGWKTYWRSPGDAGLPARLDWQGSDNLREAAIAWPAPHRFTLFDLQTFGYDGEIVLPVRARPAEPGQPLDLKARLDLLVCSNVCVPETFDLALALPAGPALPGAEAHIVNRFAALVPGEGAAVGLDVETARAVALGDGAALEVVATSREPFGTPDVFVEADPYLALGEPIVQLDDGARRAVITLPLDGEAPDRGLAGRAVTLTLVDGARAMEHATEIVAGTAVETNAWARFAVMVALAVAGGLVLNLMPCVLPVLSLKLLSLARHGGTRAGVRASFLATAAGIMFSFLLIALGLMALEAAGRTVGWGVQFQQPVFIAAMVVLVTLFACNLWGLFELPLPRFLAAAAGARGDGLAGHFATGAFATLLATPCSAPFLGTAVGFALAAGGVTIPAIFLALGLGLALPYLVVAAMPRLALLLPRPGLWMLVLRRILGFALAGTGVWLLTIMAVQRGSDVALMVGGMMLAIVAALAVRRAAPVAGAAAALALAAAALLVPAVQGHAERGKVADSGAIDWVAFDRDAVRGLVAQGRTVLVDVTADWCITCQANKSLVLESGKLADDLADQTVAMRADWTLPDDKIAAYLASHGRYGIPFNVVYGPGAPQGILLPEILTEGAVRDALGRASLPVQAGLGF